jgi:hypothetical protein
MVLGAMGRTRNLFEVGLGIKKEEVISPLRGFQSLGRLFLRA